MSVEDNNNLEAAMWYVMRHIDTTSETWHDDLLNLLEEFGEDKDLPEGWWMEYGDADDMVNAYISLKNNVL